MTTTKSLVSRHIKSLESELTCTLFHRTTRSVTLTEAGRELLEIAQKIEELTLKASKTFKIYCKKT
ncbi:MULTISPECIES: LysR family transcriptional regulator [Vibrio]|uniref:LysR family transcriptional regulator n=1 Tax=Vibrio TaxID=662 RepID=UPI0020C77988|nr:MULTISPECIES: LysR family transcriptional regulator [Vibrio]MCT4347675.1 LysR family transcriptional regulator [Vibrio sp. NC2]MCW4438838.1 LysR family transcriptional regulator [Vibrio splendidus]